ncbi:hypothetical protein CHLNCDRAFT_59245 [Chlorella variabilis]|uniref:Importin N-terminal domain-containing protein n=1 Tax=Chlorella variabilis TaxID=554065 RepID=E1ZRX8_CHLVA|nr:hypothetical protein CHLNCDRAFT_59245 [Chlorella variabilis]EFN51416.1 hypothetical protein CHLNCDRAFT_59245 [Chlorella variabilis]|eukprot:XP_005843518.1 hypothetical protein CHLNCDRAFT_59245 [Chlorella variabilis]
MYKRDFGILLLSVCALYLSLQHEGAYQFKKAWYHSFSDHEPALHELEEHPQPLPPPLVADLNGDGKPEVVVVTPTGRVQLLAPRRFGDGFAKAEAIGGGPITTMAGLEALVAGDAGAFEQLCALLMSSQNEQRSQAEAVFAELKKHPDACAQQLVRALRHSHSLEARGLCAVLLRKVLTRDDASIWPGISPPGKAAVKQEMLNCIREEPMRAVTKKVCDCVSELAAGILEDQGWPELLPFIFQLVQSGQPRLVESALLIFAAMARYVMGVLTQYMGTLNGVLQQCLGAAETEVRLAAIKATCVFISELESAEDRDKFQSTLPALLACIGRSLNEGDESSAQDAIEMFIEIAEAHPRFLRRQLPQVVDAMLQIAESESLDEGVRTLAAEFLVTLCEAREKAPGMMRKLPQAGAGLAAAALARRRPGAGAGFFVGVGRAVLIAEGCCKVFVKQTDALTGLCLQGVSDAHPKEEQHAKILPAVMSLMDDFANPRVQAHACAAVVNFAESSDQDTIAPYLDALISKLLALLQRGRRNVQEGALTALAAVADTAEEYFIKYYETCMPLMTSILTHASGKEQQLLRAKALECVSLVGLAVGKERFGNDAKGVMQYMQQVQAAGLDSDDPLSSYMLQAGARICKTLGQDFLPYLQLVMPPLLAAAQLKPDVIVSDAADEDGGGEEEGDEDTETFIVSGKRVSLHTSVLEEKATACNMICCYADELREGFYPYVEQAKDFHRNLGELADALVVQHAYHMSAEESETRHYGEASCRDYRASVLAALPHSWHSPLDTALVPAHFEKHRAGTGAQKQGLSRLGTLKGDAAKGGAAGGKRGGGGGGAAAGVAGKNPGKGGGAVGKVVSAVVKGATKGEGPAAARRHAAQPPNVVVAHLEEGIEAIHLFSGRTGFLAPGSGGPGGGKRRPLRSTDRED